MQKNANLFLKPAYTGLEVVLELLHVGIVEALGSVDADIHLKSIQVLMPVAVSRLVPLILLRQAGIGPEVVDVLGEAVRHKGTKLMITAAAYLAAACPVILRIAAAAYEAADVLLECA